MELSTDLHAATAQLYRVRFVEAPVRQEVLREFPDPYRATAIRDLGNDWPGPIASASLAV